MWFMARAFMPKRSDIQFTLINGTGPIFIGQACEFDYSERVQTGTGSATDCLWKQESTDFTPFRH